MSGWSGFDEKWVEDNRDRIVDPTPYEDDETNVSGEKGYVRGLAKGKRPTSEMNKTEQRWARSLDMREDVLTWFYECIGLRLGKGTYYYPDFVVLMENGALEIHEVKGGHIRPNGRTKFYSAAERFPIFTWRLMQWENGEWEELEKL